MINQVRTVLQVLLLAMLSVLWVDTSLIAKPKVTREAPKFGGAGAYGASDGDMGYLLCEGENVWIKADAQKKHMCMLMNMVRIHSAIVVNVK